MYITLMQHYNTIHVVYLLHCRNYDISAETSACTQAVHIPGLSERVRCVAVSDDWRYYALGMQDFSALVGALMVLLIVNGVL